jgi:hypothetical protein
MLVRIDFQRLLQQQPSCLQDGQLLMEFLIEHCRDKNFDICDHQYWLEYHSTNSPKSLSSVDYHILQPFQYLEAAAKPKQVTPCCELENIDDLQVSLHWPFNFATLLERTE